MIRYHQNTYNKLEKSIMISDKHVQEQYKKTRIASVLIQTKKICSNLIKKFCSYSM